MSDSSIGSKARANKISIVNGQEVFLKHFYREFYDPTQIIICENFLKTIPDSAILFSCAEIIKMALFQSDPLLDFLLSKDFEPFKNKKSLLKAILWATDLKRICMEVDPKETANGAKLIIREGHAFADKLEKESGFKVSHGEAVLRGIANDLEQTDRSKTFMRLCTKLKINHPIL